MESFRCHKFQESISYYTEDIDWSEGAGSFIAPGVGDRTGEQYDIFFCDDPRGNFYICNVTRHNEIE